MIRSTWSSGRNQLLVRWSSFVLLYIISGKWWSFLWGHLRKHIKHLFRILHHVKLISVEQMKILKQKVNFNTKNICIYIYTSIYVWRNAEQWSSSFCLVSRHNFVHILTSELKIIIYVRPSTNTHTYILFIYLFITGVQVGFSLPLICFSKIMIKDSIRHSMWLSSVMYLLSSDKLPKTKIWRKKIEIFNEDKWNVIELNQIVLHS